MRKTVLLLSALALAIPQLDAQRAPRRPRLTAGADTNDANAYLNHGHRIVEDNASAAVAAYYWAVRIDPASADALYGLHIAMFMRRPTPFIRYMEGNERTIFSKEMRAIDSLYFRALQIDPFFHPRHQRTIQFVYFRQAVGAGVNPGQLDFAVERLFDRQGPATRARIAVGAGQFPAALALYTEAITAAQENSRNATYLYLERGRLNAMQGYDENAILDYEIGLTELRKRDLDRDSSVVYYSSKALHQNAVGLLQARRGDVEKAREAFGKAMEEDLSFYPSHVALAQLALDARDTATAVSEMSLAAELAPTEAHVQYRYGEMLVEVGQHADAIAPLLKAVALEPYYASPQYQLGLAYEQTGDGANAREAYAKFLALTTRRDPRRQEATRRLAAVGGMQQ